MAAENGTCAVCGCVIDEKNGWLMPEKFGERYVPYCAACQEKHYKNLAVSSGYKTAMFLCAAAFNVPYLPEFLDEGKKTGGKSETWLGYLSALRKHEIDRQGKGFSDGVTDLQKAFGGELGTLEVDDYMLNDEEYKAGHAAQVKDWGYGPDERPYTQEDYDALDGFRDAMIENRVNVSAQAELAIKNISMMRLEQRKCLYSGDFAKAKQLEDMIAKEMEAEQLRKKDELPQDRVRLDDIVLACERAGLLGKSYDELVHILSRKMFHSRYGYTRDAADQMILLIRNATAWNEGRMEVDRLPDEMAMQDPLGEFAKTPDEMERQTYKDLQLTPLNMGR